LHENGQGVDYIQDLAFEEDTVQLLSVCAVGACCTLTLIATR